MKRKGYMVIATGKQWAVRRIGALKSTRLLDSKVDAIAFGKGIAGRHQVPLYIHRKDGMVEQKWEPA